MRSTVAGLSAFLVLVVFQAVAKSELGRALLATDEARRVLAAVALGATFATFLFVYFAYRRRWFRPGRRRRRRW